MTIKNNKVEEDYKKLSLDWLRLGIGLIILFCFIGTAFASITDGLVAYYKLDETTGTTAVDSTGNNNGTINGATINQNGKIRTSFYFDGSGDQVDLGTTNSFSGNASRTYNVWFKVSSKPGASAAETGVVLIGQSDGTCDDSHFDLQLVETGLYFHGCGSGNDFSGAITYSVDTWYMATVTHDSSTNITKLWFNGSEVGTQNNSRNTSGSATTYLAYEPRDNRYYAGHLDEIGIWNRALSQSEIEELYNSGFGLTYPFVPDAIFADFDYVVDGLDVDLTDTSINYNAVVIDSWEWLIDDVSVSTDQNYSFTGTDSTDYNVCLIVQGSILSLEDSTCQTISISDVTPPVTTFSSFQVPNTNDQNITLTCTDNNTGCKTINYNINNEGWKQVSGGFSDRLKTNLVSYYKFDETSGTTAKDELGINNLTHKKGVLVNQIGIIGKSAGYDGSNDWTNKASPTGYSGNNQSYNIWVKLDTTATTDQAFLNHGATSGCGIGASAINLSMKDNDEIYYGISCSSQSTSYTWTTDWTMITITAQRIGNDTNVMLYVNGNFIASSLEVGETIKLGENFSLGQQYAGGSLGRYFDGLIDEVGTWNKILTPTEITQLYNNGNGLPYSEADLSNYSFLYSGAGDHNIQYFSTDYADNDETIKTSNFTTYGSGRFYFKDENSGSDLTGVQVNFNGVDYDSGANNYIDFNFQTLSSTNTTYSFTLSKSGYSTRYYQIDLNYFSEFDTNFALLPNTIDSDIPFKVYETDETTIFSNTYVEVKDKDTNYTVGRLKTNSSGEVTFNIRLDDSNYWTIVDDGAYTYSPVTLTILYPKDEETLAQITEKWKIEITQNIYAYYPDLNTTKIVYLLPNTALPYNIKIGDMNGNYFQRTYSKIYPGNPLTDTLQPYLVKTATGLPTTITTKNAITNTNISGITIKIYKFIPGQGRTLVEQVTTDNKGQAISLLVLGSEYEFECYSGATFIKTYTITATSSTIFIYLQPTTDTPENSPSGFAVKYTPTYSGLNKLNVGTQVFTQTAFNNYGVSVSYVSQIIQGGILSSQSYTGSDANKTFSHTINWIDINNDVPVVSRLTITYGGKNYVYQTNYIVNDSFGTNYNLFEGLSTGLRSDAGCEATGICFPLMTIALLLSIGLTIWVAISMGQLGQQTAGIVLLLAMVVFTYLSWIPFELTVACVLILLAFVVNERRN